MKKITRIALSVLSFIAFALPQGDSSGGAPAPVLRDPFTLKLHLDKGQNYEEHFDKAPYVADNAVYLFAGDSFGIKVNTSGDEISGVTYMKDNGKADVTFQFKQEKSGGRSMMLLVVHSKLKRRLFMDAWMTLPDKSIHKTSLVPVGAGLGSFESWPQPIVQLVLKNFRFSQ